MQSRDMFLRELLRVPVADDFVDFLQKKTFVFIVLLLFLWLFFVQCFLNCQVSWKSVLLLFCYPADKLNDQQTDTGGGCKHCTDLSPSNAELSLNVWNNIPLSSTLR